MRRGSRQLYFIVVGLAVAQFLFLLIQTYNQLTETAGSGFKAALFGHRPGHDGLPHETVKAPRKYGSMCLPHPRCCYVVLR
jgi:hypothetical protein